VKRLNVGSRKQCHTIGHGSLFSNAENLGKIQTLRSSVDDRNATSGSTGSEYSTSRVTGSTFLKSTDRRIVDLEVQMTVFAVYVKPEVVISRPEVVYGCDTTTPIMLSVWCTAWVSSGTGVRFMCHARHRPLSKVLSISQIPLR